MSVYVSPLRYPGGKRKLANYIKLIFRYNDLLDGCYIEPYAGGAAVALSLLFSEHVSKIYINDISKPIFAFWFSVINHTEELCEFIQNADITVEEWNKQKLIQNDSKNNSIVELGFSTFFLNRTNRSGILKGGVIGGKKQNGPYKLDARFNKIDLVQRIKKVARYSNRISLHNMDTKDFIREIEPSLPQNSLIYFDPPYYVKGKGLYEDYYEHKDHQEISDIISSLNCHWIVSYDKVSEIEKMYSGYQQVTYNLSYSTMERYRGSEIMFFSNNLIVPPIKNPDRISNKRLANILQQELPF